MSRWSPVLLMCLIALLLASPALAGQTSTTLGEEAGTTTTQAEETTTTRSIPDPAVTTVPPEPEPPEDAWTYRYLVPTAALLGIVTALGIIVAYFVKVTRSRYRVVE